jgi:hypothetical protein
MRSVWAAAFVLRRLRGDGGVALMVFALVAITAFLFAAAPRLFNNVADAGLRHELDEAGPVQRNLQISVLGEGRGSRDPVAALDGAGEEFLDDMPASVRETIDRRAGAHLPQHVRQPALPGWPGRGDRAGGRPMAGGARHAPAADRLRPGAR